MRSILVASLALSALASCQYRQGQSLICPKESSPYIYVGSDGTEYVMRADPLMNSVEVRINYINSDRDEEVIFPSVSYDEKFFSFANSILVPSNIDHVEEWSMDNISCSKEKNEIMANEILFHVNCHVSGEGSSSKYSYSTTRGITSLRFSFLAGIEGGDLSLKSRMGLGHLCHAK